MFKLKLVFLLLFIAISVFGEGIERCNYPTISAAEIENYDYEVLEVGEDYIIIEVEGVLYYVRI